jgi:hypothetical protein
VARSLVIYSLLGVIRQAIDRKPVKSGAAVKTICRQCQYRFARASSREGGWQRVIAAHVVAAALASDEA